MMTTYDEAWQAYREAVDELYRPGGSAERSASAVALDDDAADRAQVVVDRSEELAVVAAAGLLDDDPDVRELAELQLVAAAAMDLVVADTLARADDAAPGAAERSATGLPAELLEILGTPQGAGITALVERRGERTAGQDPRAALNEAVEDTVTDIVDDAAKVTAALTTSLLDLPVLPLKEAAAIVGIRALEELSDRISLVLRKAVALVVKAIEKLVRALGDDVVTGAGEEASDWLRRLRDGQPVHALLTWLYEPDRVIAEARQVADTSTADDAARRQVTEHLKALADRFDKHRTAVEWLARGLNLARGWLLGLQPGGPVGLVATHVVAMGYIVYVGGDHVDWYRTDRVRRLDLVAGVRTTVRRGLNPDGAG
jgi:hypothetical protein